MRMIERLGLIQIDSVNVLARAHEVPLWSRLGPAWDPRSLMRMAHSDRRLFEYWGHEASFIPISSEPLFRWRKQEVRDGEGDSSNRWWARWTKSNERLLQRVRDEVSARGPLAASDIQMGARTEKWWGWQDERKALEWLYSAGELVVSGRRASFEREFDLPERVWPPDVIAAPTPDPDDAKRDLLRIALRACGVATASDLADHFRLRPAEVKRLVTSLVEAGEAVPIRVEGWRHEAFLDPDAKLPRSIEHRTLLSPFDPLIWNRQRVERLFGFRYRIEIYVPAPKRVHGYYVVPYLQDEQLAARFDLKADRKAGVLRVLAAHSDGDPEPSAAMGVLGDLAGWLDLKEVDVDCGGALARALRASAGRPRPRRGPGPQR